MLRVIGYTLVTVEVSNSLCYTDHKEKQRNTQMRNKSSRQSHSSSRLELA
jgi:hypothetical protein